MTVQIYVPGYARENDPILRVVEERTPDESFLTSSIEDETLELFRETTSQETYYTRRLRSDGSIRRESFGFGVEAHRIGWPAEIHYYPDGRYGTIEWHREDRLHRLDGPAEVVIEYTDDEAYVTYEFYVDGEKLDNRRDLLTMARRNFYLDQVADELALGHFGPLLTPRIDPFEIVGAVGDGIDTLEGVRAYLDGAPLEWVLAFEASAR